MGKKSATADSTATEEKKATPTPPTSPTPVIPQLTFCEKLDNYMRAGFPVLYVETWEETRAIQDILSVVRGTPGEVIKGAPRVFYEWDFVAGLHSRSLDGKILLRVDKPMPLPKVLETIASMGKDGEKLVVVLKDFHHHMGQLGQMRALRNEVSRLKTKGTMLIILAPVVNIPVDLEKDIQVLPFSLPDAAAVNRQIDFVLESARRRADTTKDAPPEITPEIRERAVEAALGLTATEVESAMFLAIIQARKFDAHFVHVIFEEKVQQFRKSGLLSHVPSTTTFQQIGGLGGLKSWIRQRSKAYSPAARAYRLPFPKGILMCGVPGTGKTLLAMAAAHELGFPLFKLDVGALFDKHVGQTEANFRRVIQILDSVGRCVVLIDELEKVFNRHAVSGTGDTGTSSRAFASFLGWLSDHQSPVFVVATSNNFTSLPPELLRKGRFDDLWWIDLPSAGERQEIFAVHLRKKDRDPAKFDLVELAGATDRFTGAEIEMCVVEGMFEAFDQGEEVAQIHLLDATVGIRPLADTMQEDIEKMRTEAKGRLRPVAEVVTSATTDARVLEA